MKLTEKEAYANRALPGEGERKKIRVFREKLARAPHSKTITSGHTRKIRHRSQPIRQCRIQSVLLVRLIHLLPQR